MGGKISISTSSVKDEHQPRQCQPESGKADEQRAPKNRLQGIDLFRQFLDKFELLRQPLLHFRNACLERLLAWLGLCLLIFEGRNGGDDVGNAGGNQFEEKLGDGPRNRHALNCSVPPAKREVVFA